MLSIQLLDVGSSAQLVLAISAHQSTQSTSFKAEHTVVSGLKQSQFDPEEVGRVGCLQGAPFVQPYSRRMPHDQPEQLSSSPHRPSSCCCDLVLGEAGGPS